MSFWIYIVIIASLILVLLLKQKTRAFQALQSQQAADLKALKQSILSKAFASKQHSNIL